MKIQALFSLKDKSKTLKCRLLQFLFGTLRVKQILISIYNPGHLDRAMVLGNFQYMASCYCGH